MPPAENVNKLDKAMVPAVEAAQNAVCVTGVIVIGGLVKIVAVFDASAVIGQAFGSPSKRDSKE